MYGTNKEVQTETPSGNTADCRLAPRNPIIRSKSKQAEAPPVRISTSWIQSAADTQGSLYGLADGTTQPESSAQKPGHLSDRGHCGRAR
ncbi:hypothetical protein PICMEDRAFT_17760 [Pichia membranifaciens NRRL Y-2026]|uniref:Uncharacterized protein n=1 Tax=Pichia membranifaciens NRRL Y-2026 TaxID=763406 RepID=A0A1E3NGL8_9ASCO|nr:hypothetical protein PICMEDRAFT_17760 [Pichia membranifaciens NRRL Y-2026]ODQ45277.1 hypothetical protein PICMEDRAFT_17760 [Pichia membranifaciens NRRL Y-2026]